VCEPGEPFLLLGVHTFSCSRSLHVPGLKTGDDSPYSVIVSCRACGVVISAVPAGVKAGSENRSSPPPPLPCIAKSGSESLSPSSSPDRLISAEASSLMVAALLRCCTGSTLEAACSSWESSRSRTCGNWGRSSVWGAREWLDKRRRVALHHTASQHSTAWDQGTLAAPPFATSSSGQLLTSELQKAPYTSLTASCTSCSACFCSRSGTSRVGSNGLHWSLGMSDGVGGLRGCGRSPRVCRFVAPRGFHSPVRGTHQSSCFAAAAMRTCCSPAAAPPC